jgi:hypothetical protein
MSWEFLLIFLFGKIQIDKIANIKSAIIKKSIAMIQNILFRAKVIKTYKLLA